jgi:hypothetical protein
VSEKRDWKRIAELLAAEVPSGGAAQLRKKYETLLMSFEQHCAGGAAGGKKCVRACMLPCCLAACATCTADARPLAAQEAGARAASRSQGGEGEGCACAQKRRQKAGQVTRARASLPPAWLAG